MSRMFSFLADRMGWQRYLAPFFSKVLPGGSSWKYTVGTLCTLLFVVQAVTGMVLAMYYTPTPELAYTSVEYVAREVWGGKLLIGIHHWTAGAMVFLVFVHLLTVYFSAGFKKPRELTWILGVGLLVVTLGFGFTGYLLPWDQKAFWATVVGTHAAGDVPWIGEWVTRLFKGGAEVSGLTLTRFYSIHMLVLPALFIGLIAAHIYLVRVHGLSVSDRVRPEEMKRPYAFFPEHMQKSSTIFAVLLAAVFALAYLLGVSRENVAGTIDPSYLPRPEWYYMWLFQLLTYFSGPLEVIGTVLIPIGGLCIVIAVPFLEKNTHHQPGKRPVPVALGVTGLMALIFLTLMGFDGARSYGQEVVVPKRVLTAAESKGLNVFVHEECSYCHTILGRGGRRSGPDLSNVVAKGRDREWLSRAISNPQTLSAWNEMPAYELNNDDLESLVAFLQALDFRDGHRLQRVGKNKAP